MCSLLTKGVSLFLLLLIFSTPLLHGQVEAAFVCGISGTTNEDLIQRLEKNKTTLDEFPVSFRSTQYVPVRFHLVARSDGSGRIPYKAVLEQLCKLNEDFAELNMRFYLKDGFDIIDNTTMYDDHEKVTFAMAERKDPNALNVWIVGKIKNYLDDENLVTPGYYISGRDWIVLQANRIGSGVLTHEVGHFFSLLHPFNGWDYDLYDPAKHGVPAPARSPGGVATELQDGSNCEVAGDRLCDTPPDYGFLSASCNFTLDVRDPSGAKIDPDERLHMSYFSSCSNYYFSPKQKELMQTDYMSTARRALRTGFTPIAEEITQLTSIIQPLNGTMTAHSDQVFLEWTTSEGANQYLIEIDRLPTFSTPDRQEILTSETSFELTNLEPGKRYFWRVRPFNETATCAFPSPFVSFTTGTATGTNDIDEITAFDISPNPAARDQDLQIELETMRGFEAQIQLFSITGQLIRKQGVVRFTSGKNIYRLPLNGISPGIYLLSMHSELGRVAERIVVHSR